MQKNWHKIAPDGNYHLAGNLAIVEEIDLKNFKFKKRPVLAQKILNQQANLSLLHKLQLY